MLQFGRDLTLVLVDRIYVMEAERTKLMNDRSMTFTVSQTVIWPSLTTISPVTTLISVL